MSDRALDDVIAGLVERVRVLEGRVGALNLLETPASLPPDPHALVGASHTASGLTTGQPLRATSATAFAFGALDLANSNATTGVFPGLTLGTVDVLGTGETINRVDDTNNNIVTALVMARSRVTVTPANGMGVRFAFQVEDDGLTLRETGNVQSLWATAASGTRKARMVFNVLDTAAREAMRLEASGTAAMIGFLGATAIARPGSTADLRQALIDLGLYTTGGASPLNLNGGAFEGASATLTGATGLLLSRGSGNQIQAEWSQSGVGNYLVYMPASTHRLHFQSGGNNNFTVDGTNRRVGVLTDNPAVTFDVNGIINSQQHYRVGGTNQVLGARITGWGTPTGTFSKATFVTDTVTLVELAKRVGQLIANLINHGMIGA